MTQTDGDSVSVSDFVNDGLNGFHRLPEPEKPNGTPETNSLRHPVRIFWDGHVRSVWKAGGFFIFTALLPFHDPAEVG